VSRTIQLERGSHDSRHIVEKSANDPNWQGLRDLHNGRRHGGL